MVETETETIWCNRGGTKLVMSPILILKNLLCVDSDLYGANDIEEARSDMIVGCVEDTFQEFRKAVYGVSDEEQVCIGCTFMWI